MSFFKRETPPPPPSTVIGPKTRFEGDISSKNAVEVAGEAKGKISTTGNISVAGHTEGTLACGTLLSHGSLKGDLNVASVACFSSTAAWEGGALVCGALKVAPGARLNGKLGGPSR